MRLRIAAKYVRLVDGRQKLVIASHRRRAPINPLVILLELLRVIVSR